MYVDQPSVTDTISILRGLRERYELHHGVKISDSALVEAAQLSDRYIADRFLPGGWAVCPGRLRAGGPGRAVQGGWRAAGRTVRWRAVKMRVHGCFNAVHPLPTAPRPPLPPPLSLPCPADKAIDLVDVAAAKLKMEITSKPLALDEVDRKVLQLEMERLSLGKAATGGSDRGARQRLAGLDSQLAGG